MRMSKVSVFSLTDTVLLGLLGRLCFFNWVVDVVLDYLGEVIIFEHFKTFVVFFNVWEAHSY